MTTKPQLGKTKYIYALRRARDSTQVMRKSLNRINDENPGPQALAMLVTRMAIAVGDIEAVLSELDEIGRTAKNSLKESDV